MSETDRLAAALVQFASDPMALGDANGEPVDGHVTVAAQ